MRLSVPAWNGGVGLAVQVTLVIGMVAAPAVRSPLASREIRQLPVALLRTRYETVTDGAAILGVVSGSAAANVMVAGVMVSLRVGCAAASGANTRPSAQAARASTAR